MVLAGPHLFMLMPERSWNICTWSEDDYDGHYWLEKRD